VGGQAPGGGLKILMLASFALTVVMEPAYARLPVGWDVL
jgi:hypothetical protein